MVSQRGSFIVTSQFPRRSLLGTKAGSSLCCGQVKTAQWPHDSPINVLLRGATPSYSSLFIGALVRFGRFLIAPPMRVSQCFKQGVKFLTIVRAGDFKCSFLHLVAHANLSLLFLCLM